MAILYPALEQVEKLKVPPTPGEKYLLEYLRDTMPDDYEVYFQPYLNGDMPDVIVMRQGCGVVIIEVKDWNLSNFTVSQKNEWVLKTNGAKVKPPYAQAFSYKTNMFNLHIDGLAEKKALNNAFYRVIHPFVFFYGSSKLDVVSLHKKAEDSLRNDKADLIKNRSSYESNNKHDEYNKKMDFYDRKLKQMRRNISISLADEELDKIKQSLASNNVLFEDDIYQRFLRYLQPPMHTAEQGKEVTYSKIQSRLIESAPGFQKVKGVAGCGKTTVLAKRAINAHKRHNDKVLILTFNITLRNLIRDKISDVREDFSWGFFEINNYHAFILQICNALGIETKPPEDEPYSMDFFERLVSDVNIFENLTDDKKLNRAKYQTILIDEIQDYKPEWVKIIRKYLLAEDGEMVLYGDESQNIYERAQDNHGAGNVQGFGRWERLTKSFRVEPDSPLVSFLQNYQQQHFLEKYDIDLLESKPSQNLLPIDQPVAYELIDNQNVQRVFEVIKNVIISEKIHPNDVVILGGKISFLREIEYCFQQQMNEKTLSTFESKEVFDRLLSQHTSVKANGSKYVDPIMELELSNIRRSKKFGFNLNSGHTKFSTVHSFKGMESKFIFFVVSNKDSPEVFYTGASRAKERLITFVEHGQEYAGYLMRESHVRFIKDDIALA